MCSRSQANTAADEDGSGGSCVVAGSAERVVASQVILLQHNVLLTLVKYYACRYAWLRNKHAPLCGCGFSSNL
jgi:hypothetical protein